jgi:hypothetical protein
MKTYTFTHFDPEDGSSKYLKIVDNSAHIPMMQGPKRRTNTNNALRTLRIWSDSSKEGIAEKKKKSKSSTVIEGEIEQYKWNYGLW